MTKGAKGTYKQRKALARARKDTAVSKPTTRSSNKTAAPQPQRKQECAPVTPSRARGSLKSSTGKRGNTDSNYYTNFDFFFKRTCFRLMTEFYKQEFKPFYKECRNLQVQQKQNPAVVVPPMHHFLVKFANKVFPGLLEPVSD